MGMKCICWPVSRNKTKEDNSIDFEYPGFRSPYVCLLHQSTFLFLRAHSRDLGYFSWFQSPFISGVHLIFSLQLSQYFFHSLRLRSDCVCLSSNLLRRLALAVLDPSLGAIRIHDFLKHKTYILSINIHTQGHSLIKSEVV